MSAVTPHLIYALLWASFGIAHSFLADARVKARLKPFFRAGYRLAYNIAAALHILAIVLAGAWLFRGTAPFDIPLFLKIIQWAMLGFGAGIFLAALAGYDMGRLAGTAQLRASKEGQFLDDEEALHTEGLHRYVRHPLYAAGFLILWGRIADESTLATALWASAYLLIGARLEERRLLARFGEAYARYRSRVPAFVPWRGRAWADEPLK